jgi:hypothetical protein
MIELTRQQVESLEHAETPPPLVVNPRTKESFVSISVNAARCRGRMVIPWRTGGDITASPDGHRKGGRDRVGAALRVGARGSGIAGGACSERVGEIESH